jgi:hypothetical protein
MHFYGFKIRFVKFTASDTHTKINKKSLKLVGSSFSCHKINLITVKVTKFLTLDRHTMTRVKNDCDFNEASSFYRAPTDTDVDGTLCFDKSFQK